MTPQQVQLIKKSWRVFQQIKPEVVGDVFYSKLFADMPSLRKMYPKDMQQQYCKLIGMLNTLVSRIEQLGVLTEEMAAMAQRHEVYGVRPAHYKVVGKALLWTLEQGLGHDYTAEVEVAWTKCYQILADTMMKATQSTQLS
ncbi:MAG: hypothetical protein JNM14_12375 [Ferruginibacter sp.]|nr:hypothetical protein [Ferruginibacter sp.]